MCPPRNDVTFGRGNLLIAVTLLTTPLIKALFPTTHLRYVFAMYSIRIRSIGANCLHNKEAFCAFIFIVNQP